MLSPRLISILKYYHQCLSWSSGPVGGLNGGRRLELSGALLVTECQLLLDNAMAELACKSTFILLSVNVGYLMTAMRSVIVHVMNSYASYLVIFIFI